MKSPFFYLSVILFFLTLTPSFAQDENVPFTVQIGSFVNPKQTDFAKALSIGFVYAVERPMGSYDIFAGGYATKEEADKAANAINSLGYNSSVSRLNVEGGQAVVVIQLVTKSSKDVIAWETLAQAGDIYFTLHGNQIKLVSGIYANADLARQELPRIKALGFDGAFVKTVNNVLLHRAGEFETGGANKKPLIPLDFSSRSTVEGAKPTAEPVKPEPKAEPVLTAKGVPAAPVATTPPPNKEPIPTGATVISTPAKKSAPVIRANVKRNSAYELQKVLKSEEVYRSSLDGYYGSGTRSAYELAMNANRQLTKYRILARNLSNPQDQSPRGSIQFFINNLWEDPAQSMKGFEASKLPLAKAYRAYFKFVNDGAGTEVNKLMNDAINEGFSGKKVSFPKFDPTATYAYFDIDQLLLHVRYLHEISTEKLGVPCWMFRKHSAAALKAFAPQGNGATSDLRVQNCGGFWEWEEIQILHAISSDLSGSAPKSDPIATSHLSVLYLTPKALTTEERKTLEVWNENLWKGLNGWASRDPFFSNVATALKISYFQTLVMLEDYFMDAGLNELESKGLALSAMKALVGNELSRFM